MADKQSFIRMTVRMPKYRRTDVDPTCNYCGRPVTVKNLQVSLYWAKQWHNSLHAGCAMEFCKLAFSGEPAELNGRDADGREWTSLDEIARQSAAR